MLLQAIRQQSFLSNQVLQIILAFIHFLISEISLVVLSWHLADQEPEPLPFDFAALCQLLANVPCI